MAIRSFHKIKLWLHTCAFILMVGIMGCALLITSNPVSLGGAMRTPMAGRIGMSMAGKGLLFLSYQVLTENIRLFKRFASTKANKILNCIETVAWGAAAGVTVYGIMQFCIGISCTLSWVMVPVSGVLVAISGFSAWISIQERRVFKKTGLMPGDDDAMKLVAVKSEDGEQGFGIVESSRSSRAVPAQYAPITTPKPTVSPRSSLVAQESFEMTSQRQEVQQQQLQQHGAYGGQGRHHHSQSHPPRYDRNGQAPQHLQQYNHTGYSQQQNNQNLHYQQQQNQMGYYPHLQQQRQSPQQRYNTDGY